MKREELMERVRASRERWNEVLARVPVERMTEPGVAGEWSVKDIVAHLTWFDREMIGLVEAKAFIGSDLWELPPHERNAEIHKRNRDRSLPEVATEAGLVFGVLVDLLGRLSDQDLADPQCFPGMPEDWVPGDIFAQNTFEHYDAHAAALERWLDGGE